MSIVSKSGASNGNANPKMCKQTFLGFKFEYCISYLSHDKSLALLSKKGL